MDACRSEYKSFSDDYQKTHALLADSMKEVGWKDQYALGATVLSNYQAMQTLVGTAMTKAVTDAAQEAAGQVGVGVDAEDVGKFGMWLRTVVKAVTNRKGAVGGAERGPCCFAAGTLVATPEGDRAIETLKVGDIVWTKPEHGGEPFAAAITATHIRNDQPIYRLTLESTRADGQVKTETLFVTPSHPFYVPARHDFVPMGDLRTGDLLQSLADGAGNNTSSRVASIRLHKPVGETFNLSVDVGHTFYVGKLKTWVHNVGPCGVPDATKPGVVGTQGTSITIEPKIANQMGKRGWTESAIQSVIDKPEKTIVTKDTRFDATSGSRLDDPATGYIAKDGSYVVRNDRTGAIVQVSNKNDPNWVAPWD